LADKTGLVLILFQLHFILYIVRGGAVVEALRYKPEVRVFDS
jgi:hypothetical protein